MVVDRMGSAGGGPIREVEPGGIEPLEGAKLRVGALVSVVKVPPAPNSAG